MAGGREGEEGRGRKGREEVRSGRDFCGGAGGNFLKGGAHTETKEKRKGGQGIEAGWRGSYGRERFSVRCERGVACRYRAAVVQYLFARF